MCFSGNISLAFAVLAFVSAAYFYKKSKYAAIGIFYFGIMELLQYFQYQVIDKCVDPWNKFLTKVGYLHICFQPLMINVMLAAFSGGVLNYPFIYASVVAGILMASRMIPVDDADLCDGRNEPLCGKKTCTFMGDRHLAWNVRLRAAGKNWFTPSIGLHFFLWVVPTLIAFKLKPIIALILTGPFMVWLFTGNIHEAPAIWCYTSVMQILMAYYLLG